MKRSTRLYNSLPNLKNKNRFLVYLFLFMVIGLSHFPVIGQEPTSIPLNCSLIKILDVKADHISTDYLGHIYIILDDQLSKYDTKGDLIATYSNKYLGKISMIDASNPLRVLVFYQDFGQLVFLDDMLSLIGDPIVLEELGMDQSTLACISVNDGIWLYEPQDFKLIRMDRNLKVTGEVYQVNQLVGTIVEPVFLLEKDNLVYLNNPGTGILVFDIFGAYIKTIPLEISNEFQVIRNTIFYYNNQGFHTYDLSLFNLARYDIPGALNHITSVRIEMGKGLLVVQKETRIELMIIGD